MSGGKAGCAACSGWGCAALVAVGVLAWWLLPLAREDAVEIGPAPNPAPAPPSVVADYVPVGSLQQFRAGAEADRLRLQFGFLDHHGRRQEIACTIRRSDYEREVRSFGFDEQAMWRDLDAELAARLGEEARRRGVDRYFAVEVFGRTAYRWRWQVPGGLDPREEQRLLSEVRAYAAWLDHEARGLGDAMIARYYRERGFRIEADKLRIDYGRIVRDATGPLADCFGALWRAGLADDDRHLLGVFLAFFQELRYEVPPEVDQGRQTLGFRVPTAVLARGAGDCDSKSAAFCALWRNFPSRVLLILVPKHALVGVEGKPGPGQAFVRLGNRYYILCEVAGPAKVPPGGHRIAGSFEYVLIEPAGSVPAG